MKKHNDRSATAIKAVVLQAVGMHYQCDECDVCCGIIFVLNGTNNICIRFCIVFLYVL